MYTLSLYTQWFKDITGEKYILYNAQSNYVVLVQPMLIDILADRDWDKLPSDVLLNLLSHHVIERTGNEFDYFNSQQVEFHARNYDPTSLGLVLVPTTNCNFGCPYCFEPKLNPKTMTPAVIDNVLEFVKAHTKAQQIDLTWYGGEPLLAFQQIKDIYSRLTQEGFPEIKSHSIVTNGVLFNEEVCDFFKSSNLNSIQITFDGMREAHNKTRCFKANNAPTFDIIYNNIKRIRELLPSTYVSLRVNVSKDTLMEYVGMYNQLKADFGEDSKLSVYPGFIRAETKDGKSLNCNSVKEKDFPEVISFFRKNGIIAPLFPQRKHRGCMMYSLNSYIIGPEGEIYKCWNDVSKADRVIGYIDSNKLSENGLMSKYLIGSTMFSDGCKHCKVFPICAGGCGYYRYHNNYHSGKFDLCSPYKDSTLLRNAILDGTLKSPISESH